MSGSCWYYGGYGDYYPEETCDLFEDFIESDGLNEKGYFIYAATGISDAIQGQMDTQMDEMLPLFFGNGQTQRRSAVTADTTVGEVEAIPAFKDFGRLLFPVDRAVSKDMTLALITPTRIWRRPLRFSMTMPMNWKSHPRDTPFGVARQVREWRPRWETWIPTEFHSYEGLPHGFGLGTGTVAEGWLNDAVAFWEEQMED